MSILTVALGIVDKVLKYKTVKIESAPKDRYFFLRKELSKQYSLSKENRDYRKIAEYSDELELLLEVFGNKL